MNPDYKTATAKAAEALTRYCIDRDRPDPLSVLRQLSNVLLMPFRQSFLYIDSTYQYTFSIGDRESMTLVNNVGGNLQYIVIYDENTDPVKLQLDLAKELGHVILQHDGSSPENVWLEEATCFAYHFISPAPSINAVVKINYRPHRVNVSASFKDMKTFDSIAKMKAAIADEQTKINRFIGKNKTYTPDDVEIHGLDESDILCGWKNYSSVTLNGGALGYCGE